MKSTTAVRTIVTTAATISGLALAGAPAASADVHLVGPGCAAYAEQVPTGPGSVAGLATAPVAVAASNSPVLTTLAAAVSGQLNPGVNLVDTLNGGQFTGHHRRPQGRRPPAHRHPDLPRRTGSAEPKPGGRHPADRRRCHPHRHRNRRPPPGQRGQRDLRRHPDRQRHALPHRHRAAAPGELGARHCVGSVWVLACRHPTGPRTPEPRAT